MIFTQPYLTNLPLGINIEGANEAEIGKTEMENGTHKYLYEIDIRILADILGIRHRHPRERLKQMEEAGQIPKPYCEGKTGRTQTKSYTRKTFLKVCKLLVKHASESAQELKVKAQVTEQIRIANWAMQMVELIEQAERQGTEYGQGYKQGFINGTQTAADLLVEGCRISQDLITKLADIRRQTIQTKSEYRKRRRLADK
jgi:hypothetical protein